MSERKCSPEDYIQFLIASPSRFSCVEAGRVQQQTAGAPGHDCFSRLLSEMPPDPEDLWMEAKGLIDPNGGALVLDDSTLDKPYARLIELVGWHYSGKHKKVVKGINLITLLWTDGDRHVPIDYRIYKKGGPTKNQLFQQMLRAAAARGLKPGCVCFDAWYASADNLREVRRLGWTFLTCLKCNRRVRQDFGPVRRLSEAAVAAEGTVLYVPEYGQVKVFRIDTPDGDTEHWATNDWGMTALERRKWADWAWRIEEYHRGLKQHCGVERCQARGETAQRNHIGMAIRAFLRLADYAYREWTTWLQAKMGIVRDAVAAYLARPYITLPPQPSRPSP
jgi:hypothetical protein